MMRTALLADRFAPLPLYDLNPQTGQSFQSPIATAHAGGSVQHGLSAAGGVYGFSKHCSAAA